jgi:hypothetical protein
VKQFRFHSRRASGGGPGAVYLYVKKLRNELYWIVPVMMMRFGMVPFLLTVILSILVFTLEHVVNPR